MPTVIGVVTVFIALALMLVLQMQAPVAASNLAQQSTPTPALRPPPPTPQPTPIVASSTSRVYLPLLQQAGEAVAAADIRAAEQQMQREIPTLVGTSGSVLRLRSVTFDGRQVTLDFEGAPDAVRNSLEVSGLMSQIDRAVFEALEAAQLDGVRRYEYRTLANGAPLWPSSSASNEGASLEAISGKLIALNPGHGRYTTGQFQRGEHFGIIEDLINSDLAEALNTRLLQMGARTLPLRELSKSAGGYAAPNGMSYPWWQMSAREYVRSKEPTRTDLWNSNPLESNSDINVRPFYARDKQADMMISIHNNGGGGGGGRCESGGGTETLYDTINGQQDASSALAEVVHRHLIEAIRANWDRDWCDRKVKGFDGAYGENREFRRGPAIIVELAFMDNVSDNSALQNPTFRAIAVTAIADALQEYYGGVVTSDPVVLDPAVRYRVTAAHSGQVLDVTGGSLADGTQIIQWPPHGGDNQSWSFEPMGTGLYRIRSTISGKCLDVSGEDTANGAAVIQHDCHDRMNQRWRIQSATGGGVTITAEHSGKVLDIAAGSLANGAPLIQWLAHGGDNQRWFVEPIGRVGDPCNGCSPATTRNLQGIFFNSNPSVRRGGLTALEITLTSTQVSGFINFSQRPEDPGALCGAGSFTGSRSGSAFTASFVSNDPDVNCGFDRGSQFTLSGTIEDDGQHISGAYTVKNASGSAVVEASGIFEVWESVPQRVRYDGRFVNAGAGVGGPVTLDLVIGTRTVSGWINFTNDPGAQLICGAGELVGERNGGQVTASFVSFDIDPGCGFDHGLQLYLTDTTLSADLWQISGAYGVSNGQAGTFSATRR